MGWLFYKGLFQGPDHRHDDRSADSPSSNTAENPAKPGASVTQAEKPKDLSSDSPAEDPGYGIPEGAKGKVVKKLSRHVAANRP